MRTIGRFVWESFAPEDAEPAKAAYDTIYSFTKAEQERYATFGIESPLLTWGCHPELIEVGEEAAERRATNDECLVLRPGQLHGQAQALPGDRRVVRRAPGAITCGC